MRSSILTGMDITVVGLDVTLKTRLRKTCRTDGTYCSERCKPAVQYMKKALEYYMNGSRVQNYTPDNCPLHDPLAMVAAVVPSIVKIQKRKARVECSGTYCRGMIVTDLREEPIEAEYISFALEVDAEERSMNLCLYLERIDQTLIKQKRKERKMKKKVWQLDWRW